MTTTHSRTSAKKALTLSALTSIVAPLSGLATAPLLARALSAEGRGELGAGLGPAGLLLAAATLGLPEACTIIAGRRPSWARTAVLKSSFLVVAFGILLIALIVALSPILSGGNGEIERLIITGSVLTIPALAINVLRGLARGLQSWTELLAERLLVGILRIIVLSILFTTNSLTVWTALLATVAIPIASGLALLPALTRGVSAGQLEVDQRATNGQRSPAVSHSLLSTFSRKPVRSMLAFGMQAWLGSVASMTIARLAQLLVVPLSDTEQMGLYAVGVTLSDTPVLVAFGIAGALFGLNSRSPDWARLTTAARLTLYLLLLGCIALGLLIPHILTPLFGQDFQGALIPCLILLGSAVVGTPGLMAGSCLTAWGYPMTRTVGFLGALIVFASLLIIMVPALGAVGAAIASVGSNLTLSSALTVLAARRCSGRVRDFLWPQASDLTTLLQIVPKKWNRASKVEQGGSGD